MTASLSSNQVRGHRVAKDQPDGYQTIRSVDGLCIKATMLRPFLADLEPEKFIAAARATNEAFFRLVNTLPASHPCIRIAAKRELARTLLAMRSEFKRRLSPQNLETYMKIAWPRNHPLAGAIDSCDPFMFTNLWRDALKPIRLRRRGRRLRRMPTARIGYQIPKTAEIPPPSLSGKMDEARTKLGKLQLPESDLSSYVTVSLDFLAAAIDIFAKGFGAKLGGTVLTIASIYLGLAATVAGGVRTQYKHAQIWGFAWGLYRYGREIIAHGHKRYLSVNSEEIWRYVKSQPAFREQKYKSVLMGSEIDRAVERGVHDGVTFMNGVMIEVRKGIEKQLNQYAGVLTAAEVQSLMDDHLFNARVEAFKYILGKVAKQLKGRNMMI